MAGGGGTMVRRAGQNGPAVLYPDLDVHNTHTTGQPVATGTNTLRRWDMTIGDSGTNCTYTSK